MVKLIKFIALLIFLAGLTLNAQEKILRSNETSTNNEIKSHKFDPNRDAEKDISSAIIEAQKTNRRILLDVGGEWCIWCHRLDTLFADNPALRNFRDKNYITVKVNYSPENKNEKVLSKYPKVAGYPHLFVLNKKGKLLHSQNTGDLESGKGHDKNKVMAFLKKWAPNNSSGKLLKNQ